MMRARLTLVAEGRSIWGRFTTPEGHAPIIFATDAGMADALAWAMEHARDLRGKGWTVTA